MASAAQRRIKSISYAKYGYIFIIPFFLVYFFFQLWPLINTFIVSFHGNGVPEMRDKFVGFDNYKALLFGEFSERAGINNERAARKISETFFNSFGNTIILWIGNFVPQIALSLSCAVFFTEANLKIPGKEFFKIVMYLPNIITAASVAVLFLQLCGENDTLPGALNQMLNKIGVVSQNATSGKFDTIRFITGTTQSRVVVMFIQTWLWFGNTMIMLMSGIQGINPSLFEAASIDGASSGQVFLKITLPLLMPIMSYTLVTSMIGGLQMFDIPFLFHLGNDVNDKIKTIAVLIFEYFHADADKNKMGLAGAASVMLFLVTLVLGCIAFYMTSDKDAAKKKKERKRMAKQLKKESKQFGGFSI